jgi:hypothetical protein
MEKNEVAELDLPKKADATDCHGGLVGKVRTARPESAPRVWYIRPREKAAAELGLRHLRQKIRLVLDRIGGGKKLREPASEQVRALMAGGDGIETPPRAGRQTRRT